MDVEGFQVKRGIKQSSLLPSSIFLLVMNTLLQWVEANGLGVLVFAHTNDIRMLFASVSGL